MKIEKNYIRYEKIRGNDINTHTSVIYFSDAELKQVLQYDESRQGDDEKIIRLDLREKYKRYNVVVTSPIKLKDAVESGIIKITELEIGVHKAQTYYFCKIPTLRLMENFGLKSLCITTSSNYTLKSSYVEDIIKLIKRYEDTLDQLECRFGKVNMTAFSKIYEELENWIINTPLNISLTAAKDEFNRPCKNLPEYNDIQAKIKLVLTCQRHSTPFTDTKKTIDERTQEYQKIVEKDPDFIKDFGKCEPSIVKKIMGDNMYNTFLRCYIDNSKILDSISKCCEDKGEYLSHDAKELIVKHIGGIAALTKIDNSLKNNNSMTDQQAEVINQAESINDVDLTTSGTIADSELRQWLI